MDQVTAYAKIEGHFRNNHERFTKRFTRYFSSKERGEDVVQSCYTNALTYWSTAPKDDTEFEKWIRTILNNSGKKNHKEEMLHGATNKEEQAEEETSTPSITIPRIIINEVTALIEAKDQPDRTVLKLAMLEGWKPADITDVVDYKLATIRDVIFKFRKEIKEKFKWSI